MQDVLLAKGLADDTKIAVKVNLSSFVCDNIDHRFPVETFLGNASLIRPATDPLNRALHGSNEIVCGS